ncbi:hypothetical protein OUZ56_027979 [Daphnia magna]|uniref:Uncharacterized protein n=1 Tax=Daphnia magna TaxID=35525 RepID=A0ABR0B2I1_9CRUS|nr:hypothetical protein OUZ56_027979 [Daphnia magna]
MTASKLPKEKYFGLWFLDLFNVNVLFKTTLIESFDMAIAKFLTFGGNEEGIFWSPNGSENWQLVPVENSREDAKKLKLLVTKCSLPIGGDRRFQV